MYELIGIESQASGETSKSTFEFRPLGLGMQDMPSVLNACLKSGSKWVVVEQDSSSDIPAMEAIRISRKYLKTQGW
jgi:hypothetical protein